MYQLLLFKGHSCTRPATQVLRKFGLGPRQTRFHRTVAAAMSQEATHRFGPHTIQSSEIFLESERSFAFVNLKPVVPGHVLIAPQRVVKRYQDLASEEVCDLWLTAQLVGSKLEKHYGAEALTLAIQDGEAAGQTVPHVHVHCLPRRYADFEHNDEVYERLEENAKDLPRISARLDLDKERVVRTQAEMSAEAAELRQLFTVDTQR